MSVLSATAADARAPSTVVEELRGAQVSDVATRVGQLPKPLRTALAQAFRERQLYIADAGQPYQVTDVVIVRPGERQLPFRRLLFAFRAGTHYVVYYQMGGYGQSISALVFAPHDAVRYRLVWGGVERDYDKPAKTPAELIRRIAQDKLFDHLPFLW